MQISARLQLLKRRGWDSILKVSGVTRWLLLLSCLCIPLTFFFHMRQEPMAVLELGTRAPYYVISQVDFSFLDEEATQMLRQEAMRDVGVIYRVDEKEVQEYRHALENSLIDHQQWRRDLPRSTFEEMYTILDQVKDWLLQARFTDERTLLKVHSLEGESSYLFALEGKEEPKGRLLFPYLVARQMRESLIRSPGLHLETVDYLLEAFLRHTWGLQPDFALQQRVQQSIKEGISARFTSVEAGLQIIKKGEVVTARHITMLQAMKTALGQTHALWDPASLLSSFILASTLIMVVTFYLRVFHREVLKSFQKVTLLISIVLLTLACAKGAEQLFLFFGGEGMGFAPFPLFIPLAALLTSILVGPRLALASSFFLLTVLSVSLAVDVLPFLLMNLFASVLALLFARNLHRRRSVFLVCGKVLVCLIPALVALNLMDYQQLGKNFMFDLGYCALFLGASAFLCVVLLPVFEFMFDVMTDMTLVEYMDPDNELLRRLSLEAPGSYQHGLIVGHIAEAAARAIGANGLFCRAAALYHDIGKLFNPHYFTENQLGGFNIHQLLTPLESTQVIIAHVAEGEVLARKHRLPQGLIDVIREHHGTTMVYYFYCKQVEQMDGDVTRVQEKAFRYPGPKPRSKESAIIMIADTVEAASRSMGEVTEEAVFDVVDKLVSKKADDGQFDECELTFEELGRVKKAMARALIVTCHLRIKYPD